MGGKELARKRYALEGFVQNKRDERQADKQIEIFKTYGVEAVEHYLNPPIDFFSLRNKPEEVTLVLNQPILLNRPPHVSEQETSIQVDNSLDFPRTYYTDRQLDKIIHDAVNLAA